MIFLLIPLSLLLPCSVVRVPSLSGVFLDTSWLSLFDPPNNLGDGPPCLAILDSARSQHNTTQSILIIRASMLDLPRLASSRSTGGNTRRLRLFIFATVSLGVALILSGNTDSVRETVKSSSANAYKHVISLQESVGDVQGAIARKAGQAASMIQAPWSGSSSSSSSKNNGSNSNSKKAKRIVMLPATHANSMFCKSLFAWYANGYDAPTIVSGVKTFLRQDVHTQFPAFSREGEKKYLFRHSR